MVFIIAASLSGLLFLCKMILYLIERKNMKDRIVSFKISKSILFIAIFFLVFMILSPIILYLIEIQDGFFSSFSGFDDVEYLIYFSVFLVMTFTLYSPLIAYFKGGIYPDVIVWLKGIEKVSEIKSYERGQDYIEIIFSEDKRLEILVKVADLDEVEKFLKALENIK